MKLTKKLSLTQRNMLPGYGRITIQAIPDETKQWLFDYVESEENYNNERFESVSDLALRCLNKWIKMKQTELQ